MSVIMCEERGRLRLPQLRPARQAAAPKPHSGPHRLADMENQLLESHHHHLNKMLFNILLLMSKLGC